MIMTFVCRRYEEGNYIYPVIRFADDLRCGPRASNRSPTITTYFSPIVRLFLAAYRIGSNFRKLSADFCKCQNSRMEVFEE